MQSPLTHQACMLPEPCWPPGTSHNMRLHESKGISAKIGLSGWPHLHVPDASEAICPSLPCRGRIQVEGHRADSPNIPLCLDLLFPLPSSLYINKECAFNQNYTRITSGFRICKVFGHTPVRLRLPCGGSRPHRQSPPVREAVGSRQHG